MNDEYKAPLAVANGLFFAMVIPALIWKAWVLVTLWGWFMVPSFGLPMLSMPAATGITVLGSLAFGRMSYVPNESNEVRFKKTISSIAGLIFCPAIALGMGWVCAQLAAR